MSFLITSRDWRAGAGWRCQECGASGEGTTPGDVYRATAAHVCTWQIHAGYITAGTITAAPAVTGACALVYVSGFCDTAVYRCTTCGATGTESALHDCPACTCEARYSDDWRAHPESCPQRRRLYRGCPPSEDPATAILAAISEPLGLGDADLPAYRMARPDACVSCLSPLPGGGWCAYCSALFAINPAAFDPPAITARSYENEPVTLARCARIAWACFLIAYAVLGVLVVTGVIG